MGRDLEARALAQRAGLWIVRVQAPGAREVGGVLELGPGWTADEVATLACRRLVRGSYFSGERQVAELVKHYGYRYVPLALPMPATA